MSMRYRAASVLILKSMRAPWSTLMSVANPWMLGSPSPWTCHSLGWLPKRQFSDTISLAGLVQTGVGVHPLAESANTTASATRTTEMRGPCSCQEAIELLRTAVA